jgi:hypothetical protein
MYLHSFPRSALQRGLSFTLPPLYPKRSTPWSCGQFKGTFVLRSTTLPTLLSNPAAPEARRHSEVERRPDVASSKVTINSHHDFAITGMAARRSKYCSKFRGLETKCLRLVVLPLLQNVPFANGSNCSAENKRK